MHDTLVQSDPQSNLGRLHEILIYLGERVPQRVDQSDDKPRLVYRPSRRQERYPAITLFLDFVVMRRRLSIAESAFQYVGKTLLRRVFA
jgi:hypothetical protein